MENNAIKSLTNPIRSRIFFEVHSKEVATTKNLLEAFPDIAQPTMYRHIKAMLDEGLLKVTDTKKIRGAVEKSYSINLDFGGDIERIVMENDGNGYLQLFSQYMIGVLAEFAAYSNSKDINIIEDVSAFSTAPIYATNEELLEACTKISEIIMPLINNEPTKDRKLRSFCTIITPPKKN